jgi:23S rRNA (guanosine2251-2'-O)-methyltransferase
MDKIFGKHSVRAVFMTRPQTIRRVLVLSEKWEPDEEFLQLARKSDITPEILPLRAFVRAARLSEEDKHGGICIFTDPAPSYGQNELSLLSDARAVLVLDQISNPRNLGTILRSAAFFGANAVVWMKDRGADLDPTAYRVAVGATEFVKCFKVANIAQTLDALKSLEFWVYGLDERGDKALSETTFDRKTVFVVGAEGQGLRDRTRKSCDFLVRIPGGRTGVESLNAGVAASIALAEFFREPRSSDREKG